MSISIIGAVAPAIAVVIALACFAVGIGGGIGLYKLIATKKLGKKLSGEALQEGVDKLSRKKLTKDILKSYKNVTKAGRILAVAGAALIGTVGGCIINRLIKNQNAGSVENKTPEISTNKKPEVLAEITEPLGKTTAEYNKEKKEKKNIEKK